MKPPPFQYERARSVQEALDILSRGATVLAGGQSLVPRMALRATRPSVLVDINEVPELTTCAFPNLDGDPLVIGATCRQATLAQWRPPDARWNAIPQAARVIGNYVIRTRGTVGGSIAHADPAGELPAVFMLFDGRLAARSVSGQRILSSSQFFSGPYETRLPPDALIIEVHLAPPPPGAVTGFHELSERIAVAGVGAGLAVDEGRCSWCRIALCGVAPTPVRACEAEQRLVGSRLTPADVEDAARLAAAACSPRSDSHASARFRRALVAALVRRNAAEIIDQLRGPS